MYRFIEFLGRFGNFLLFLLLEIIALVLVITLNSRHEAESHSYFLEMSGHVSEVQNAVTGYFSLGAANEKLQRENIELRKRMHLLENEITAMKNMQPFRPQFLHIPDSLLPVSTWDYIPCRAINNSVTNAYNYITLDRGSKHGVRPGMGVLSPQGIAGTVAEVSENYALAISVLSTKFRISAKIMPNNIGGTLYWDGRDAAYGILQDIPQTSVIEIGDTVVTTSYGVTFPENCVVGTVKEILSAQKDGFFRIKILFATQFRSLDNLYLIDNTAQEELDSLVAKVQDPPKP